MIYKKLRNSGKDIKVLIGMFLLFFVMLLVYIHLGEFLDEADNILGGRIVANGGSVYKEFYSQHTPGMYYLCSIFAKLGANTLIEYRLLLYATLSIIWVLMYAIYSKNFGKMTMLLYPILYICIMASMDHGNKVLSEQIQAQAMVIIFLEFILYIKTKKITIRNSILISIAIFASVSVAFVSVFAIAVVALGICLIEIQDGIEKELRWNELILQFVRKYWKLAAIILAPFMLVIICYFLKGTIRDVYEQAFELNTKIYSKYLDGGFGNNALITAVNSIKIYFDTIDTMSLTIFTKPLESLRVFVNIFVNIYFLIFLYKKKKKSAIFIMSLFILMVGIRAFTGFHSIPYWAVTAMMGLIMLNDWMYAHNNMPHLGGKELFITIILLIIITTPYFKVLPNIVISKQDFVKSEYPKSRIEYYIEKLTNKEDKIFISNIGADVAYVNSDRLPASRVYCIVPWFMELFQNDLIDDIDKNKPKLIEYDPEYAVWGHKNKDTSASFENYIKQHYKMLKISDVDFKIWIRNDYYDQASEILGLKQPIFFIPTQKMNIVGPVRDGHEFLQVFKADGDKINKIRVQIGTYARSNNSELEMSISDMDTKEILYTTKMDMANMKDNEMNEVNISNINITKNKEYVIKFKAYNTTDNNFVTIYRTEQNLNESMGYAVIDGEKQPFNLNVAVY